MRDERDHGAARRVRAVLDREQELDLLHILTCPTCWLGLMRTLQEVPGDASIRGRAGRRREELAKFLRASREGDGQTAGRWYTRAKASAEAAGDIGCEVYLLRCSVLVYPAPQARPLVERAWAFARSHGLAGETLRCQANLGLVHLELGEWDEAKSHLAACQASLSLGGAARAAVLNNLGIAVAPGNRADAMSLISSSLATAGRTQVPAILSNLAVLLADDNPGEAPSFEHVAPLAAEECDASLLDCVMFNQARSLVDTGEVERALQLVVRHGRPAAERRDGDLLAGRWAHLEREIGARLSLPATLPAAVAVAALAQSSEPQAWLYRARWAYCPLPLYDAAPTIQD